MTHYVNKFQDGTYQSSGRGSHIVKAYGRPPKINGVTLDKARVFIGKGPAKNSLRDHEKPMTEQVEVNIYPVVNQTDAVEHIMGYIP